LLTEAETAAFDLLLTTDKRILYQQNLTGRKIAIVVLRNSTWRVVRFYLYRIALAVNAAVPGSYTEVEIPHGYPPVARVMRLVISLQSFFDAPNLKRYGRF